MSNDGPQEYRTVIQNISDVNGGEGGQSHVSHMRILIPLVILLSFALAGLAYVNAQLSPPESFSPGTVIVIPDGYTLKEIATQLTTASVIRSPLFFALLVQHYGKENSIPSGTYLFKKPASLVAIARQMALGDHGMETIKVTLPEGLTASEMAKVLEEALPSFDATTFLSSAKINEGYLFPDTYFFYSTATSGDVLLVLKENFEIKTASLQREVTESGKDWHDVVVMASIIEEEAATPEDRRIVSGILWNRISRGMRLQVDATFAYTIGKGSLELTVDDLQSDSPYNTYRINGLPPAPIANPGIDALYSAVHPTPSPYVYYLSDKTGVMHYAKTFEEHKLGKAKYLR